MKNQNSFGIIGRRKRDNAARNGGRDSVRN